MSFSAISAHTVQYLFSCPVPRYEVKVLLPTVIYRKNVPTYIIGLNERGYRILNSVFLSYIQYSL